MSDPSQAQQAPCSSCTNCDICSAENIKKALQAARNLLKKMWYDLVVTLRRDVGFLKRELPVLTAHDQKLKEELRLQQEKPDPVVKVIREQVEKLVEEVERALKNYEEFQEVSRGCGVMKTLCWRRKLAAEVAGLRRCCVEQGDRIKRHLCAGPGEEAQTAVGDKPAADKVANVVITATQAMAENMIAAGTGEGAN